MVDARILAAMPVRIHSKQPVIGVFCSTPPHLKDDEDVIKLTEMCIDTGLGEKGRDIVSVGDRVTFLQPAKELSGGRITGKSFDDRAGVAALIEVAHQINKLGVPPAMWLFCLVIKRNLVAVAQKCLPLPFSRMKQFLLMLVLETHLIFHHTKPQA